MLGTDLVIEITSRPTFCIGIASSRDRSDENEKNNVQHVIRANQ